MDLDKKKPELRLRPLMTFDNGLMVAAFVDEFSLPVENEDGSTGLEAHPAGSVVVVRGPTMSLLTRPITMENAVKVAANTLHNGLPDQGPLADLCAGMIALAEVNRSLLAQITRQKVQSKLILPGRMN